MVASWALTLGDGASEWSGKMKVPTELLTVFQPDDRYTSGPFAGESGRHDGAGSPVVDPADDALQVGYEARAEVVRTRLHLMGFTAENYRRELAEKLERDYDLRAQDDAFSTYPPDLGPDVLTRYGLSWDEAVDIGLRKFLAIGWNDWLVEPGAIDTDCYQAVRSFMEDNPRDFRRALAAVLDYVDPATPVCLDLSDLLAAGWLDQNEALTLTTRALEELRATSWNTGSIIVVTEGKFDSRVLSLALRLVRPDVAGYFTFLDLETTKAQGGTDRVVANLRSFAAAGVMNRVIGLFDNDTAGRVAQKQLANISLPRGYAACRLPDLDYARSYPCLGPEDGNADINGRACAVEFYFGLDCLRGPDHQLVPVRWKTFIDPPGQYQGELTDKRRVQDRIEDLLKSTTSDNVKDARWDPMRQVAQTLIDAATSWGT